MRKSSRVLAIICAILCLCTGLTACTGTKSDTSKVQETKKVKRIDIKDLSWEITSGIIDEKRYAVMNLTNNSEFTITKFSLQMALKSNVTDEQKQLFYKSINDLNQLSNDEFEEIKQHEPQIHFAGEKVIKSKATANNIHCYYFTGSHYVIDSSICELFEPDIAIISYVSDNRIMTTNYDFKAKNYSDDSQSVEAFQWTKSAFGTVVPKPSAEVVEMVYAGDKSFDFTIHGTEKTDYESYVEKCKQQGFTSDAKNYDFDEYSMFTAKNEAGYEISVHFSPDDSDTSCTVNAPNQ